jgi:myo-inositol-1(or 4)-monophosphatase
MNPGGGPDLNAADLALIRAAALEAGELALGLRKSDLKIQTKPGGSPVTSADLALDALLKRRLGEARPDYGWLSEETADDRSRLAAGRTFVVDPIDGTIAYIKDRPWWTVSIAVVEAGMAVAGVVHAPAVGETYEAALGDGARLNGETIHVSGRTELEGCAMLSDAGMLRRPEWPQPWPPMRVETRNSVAYRLALTAAGAFDAVLAMSSKCDWDVAAGDLIAREAGAIVSDHGGGAYAYDQASCTKPSLVCAGPALYPLILERVRNIKSPG